MVSASDAKLHFGVNRRESHLRRIVGPYHPGHVIHMDFSLHQEKVVTFNGILLQLYRKGTQIIERKAQVIEYGQGILPVQGNQRVGNIRQQHQGTVGLSGRRNLYSTSSFFNRIVDAVQRFVRDVPAFALVGGVIQVRDIAPPLFVVEIASIVTLSLFIENEYIQVVYPGLVRIGGFGFSTYAYLDRCRCAKSECYSHGCTLRHGHACRQAFPDAGNRKCQDRKEEYQGTFSHHLIECDSFSLFCPTAHFKTKGKHQTDADPHFDGELLVAGKGCNVLSPVVVDLQICIFEVMLRCAVKRITIDFRDGKRYITQIGLGAWINQRNEFANAIYGKIQGSLVVSQVAVGGAGRRVGCVLEEISPVGVHLFQRSIERLQLERVIAAVDKLENHACHGTRERHREVPVSDCVDAERTLGS